MNNIDYNLTNFPAEREIVIDAGYLGTGRHVIYALLEVDVTQAQEVIHNMSTEQGGKTFLHSVYRGQFCESDWSYSASA